MSSADEAVEALYRSDWGRIVAALIRLVGDFEVAEEAVQEAFAAGGGPVACSGVPDIPRAWIIQTARHKAIDIIRRRARFNEKVELVRRLRVRVQAGEEPDYDTPKSRRPSAPDLHLLPPAWRSEAQVALTLRTLGGVWRRTRSRGLFWSRPPPWPSAWSAPSARSATRAFPIPCPTNDCPSASTPCSPSSISSSTKATRPPAVARWSDRSLRRSHPPGAPGTDWTRPPRRSHRPCSLSCCFTTPGAMPVLRQPAIVVLEEQDRRRWDHAQIAEALPLAAESLRATPGPDESERRFLNRRLRDLQRRES